MKKSILFILVVLAGVLFVVYPEPAAAQETDTTNVVLDPEDDEEAPIQLDRGYERSVSGGSLTDMGTYQVPGRNQYYIPPFEAQKELDQFMEEYREEMKKNWYWQFLRATSPFIRLHLGVRDFNTLDIVGRDNPLFQSYKNKQKRQ